MFSAANPPHKDYSQCNTIRDILILQAQSLHKKYLEVLHLLTERLRRMYFLML